jgi:transmembrane sensor
MSDHDENNPEVDWRRLSQYVAGEGSAAERATFEQWIAADPAHRALVDEMQAVWRVAPVPAAQSSGRADAVWQAFRSEITKARQLRPAPRVAGTQRSQRPYLAGAALIAAGVMLWVGVTHIARAPQPFREFATQAGSRATITLRDGTHVLLGPATHLRVPVDFARGARGVELDGQALFTVVHDAAHPFSVRTAYTVVRDVGTTFSVDAYAADQMERVAVTEGVVEIGGHTLRARDVAAVGAGGRLTLQSGTDVNRYLAWVQGGLTFDNAPLPDVLRAIGRAYGVDVTLADTSLARRTVTASFGDDSLDEVLASIAKSVGAQVQRDGRRAVVTRHAGGPHSAAPLSTVEAARSRAQE